MSLCNSGHVFVWAGTGELPENYKCDCGLTLYHRSENSFVDFVKNPNDKICGHPLHNNSNVYCPDCEPSQNPMHEDWELKFDEMFRLNSFGMSEVYKQEMNPSHVKYFIRQLLKTQKSQLKEKIEKMKKKRTFKYFKGSESLVDDGYNQALDDLLKEL